VYTIHFAKLGYVAATVSYRLLPAATFPAQIEDVKCAVRWMRSRQRESTWIPNGSPCLAAPRAVTSPFSPPTLRGRSRSREGRECRRLEPRCSRRGFLRPHGLDDAFARAASQVKSLLGGRASRKRPISTVWPRPLHLTKEAPPP